MEIEIENRIQKLENNNGEFFMVDLIIDKEVIKTGDNHIDSFSFWEDIFDSRLENRLKFLRLLPRSF